MAAINLRDLFPEYCTLDCFVDVLDDDKEEFVRNLTPEAVAIYAEFQRDENAYERRIYRNDAHYSLDQEDGIESDVLHCAADLLESCIREQIGALLHEAVNTLPEKQRKRIYAHFVLGVSKAEIARKEDVDEKAVRVAIERGLASLRKIFKNF